MNWKTPCNVLQPLLFCLLLQNCTATAQTEVTSGHPSSDTSMASTHTSPIATTDVRQKSALPSGDFRLGVGDVIHISVWHEQELTQTAVVRPDGKVSLPLAGELAVAGQTAVEVQELLRVRLLPFLVDPQVTVSVLEIHSRQVYITGQVQRPGAYPLTGKVGVLQLIASAGGLTPYAHRKDITILDASNHLIARFNYKDAIDGRGKDSHPLQPGETVVVP